MSARSRMERELLPLGQRTDYARLPQSAPNAISGFGEAFGDNAGSAVFLETEFGMGVQIAPQGHPLIQTRPVVHAFTPVFAEPYRSDRAVQEEAVR